jgi:hypothetical protein
MKQYFFLFIITLIIYITYMTINTNHDKIFSLKIIKFNFLSQYQNIPNCNINLINNNHNFSEPADNSTHSLRIVRAIIIYFPVEKFLNFKPEFKWMYRSWIEMQKYEPVKWRTDIIIFINTENKFFIKMRNIFFKEFNCTLNNRRRSPIEKPMCSLIKYIPLKQRFLSNSKQNKVNIYDYMLNNVNIFNDDQAILFYSFLKTRIANYSYLDSILMAFDGWNYFKSAGYNYLIRSDMDVFFTPLFGQWLPRNCNDFYVGGGGYSSDFNIKRLKRIASNIGFKYASVTNLGSTWYSTPDQFRLVSYLTLFGMAYLSEGNSYKFDCFYFKY